MSGHLQTWSDERAVPAERLVAFERWLAAKMGEILIWPRDQVAAQKQIGQCRSFVMHAVADLGRHGYLFRPRELAAYLLDELERIATYQRKGTVSDFHAYFRECWRGWVGRNAEELRAVAERKGVLRGHAAPQPVSIPELALRSLEAKNEEIESKRRFRSQLQAARKGRLNRSSGPFLPGLGGR